MFAPDPQQYVYISLNARIIAITGKPLHYSQVEGPPPVLRCPSVLGAATPRHGHVWQLIQLEDCAGAKLLVQILHRGLLQHHIRNRIQLLRARPQPRIVIFFILSTEMFLGLVFHNFSDLCTVCQRTCIAETPSLEASD